MKISLDWLREYVRVELSVDELVRRLTMIGLVPGSVEERDGDVVLDLETYANRPDTLGHLGVAREVGAMLGEPLTERTWPLAELERPTAEMAEVEVLDERLCRRYCGAVVRDVPVGPSPEWLRRRLEAVGLRPINNVVDVSNYVLFATGQPIHTFDLDRLGGSKVVVRRAKRGETLVDLDGRRLDLEPDMLVIADESRPVALAGVIGGQGSGITESTRNVFIESAWFDPVSVRKTSRRLGLATDAAYRFERGADIGFAPRAALMAASLLTQMGGRAGRGLIDLYPKPAKPRSLRLRAKRVADLLGVEVPEGFIEDVLGRLGFRLERSPRGLWKVEVPSFRVDIEREADLIEEIARFYGYDRIPSRFTPAETFELGVNRKRERLDKVRQTLLAQGFDEVVNWSFADPEREAAMGSGLEPVAIENPISGRASVLRTTLLPGLLESAAWNLHRELEGVHIFEIGPAYHQDGETPREGLRLGILSTGRFAREGWEAPPREADILGVKGAIEAVLEALRFEPIGFEEKERAMFEKGRTLAVLVKGEAVGCVGEVRAGLAAGYDLGRPVFAAEIDLDALFAKSAKPFEVAPPPKFPAVVRDLSFLVDAGVRYREIERLLERLDQPLLEGVELVDRFAGPPLPEGRVSLTLRLRFRHPERTLVAEEVDRAVEAIAARLSSGLKIEWRERKIDK